MERRGSARAHAVRSEALRRRFEETETRTRKIFGITVSEKVVKKEKVEYLDLEDEGLKAKTKRNVKETPSVPSKLRKHAESLISQVYADAKDNWNPFSVAETQTNASYSLETDESQNQIGITLRDRGVEPTTILRLCNSVFTSPEGINNKDFQDFLMMWVKTRMGIKEQQEESPEDKNF